MVGRQQAAGGSRWRGDGGAAAAWWWWVAVVLGHLVASARAGLLETNPGLAYNFYQKSCPSVDSIVRSVTWAQVAANSTLPARLLRLHFHDCFVKVRLVPFPPSLLRPLPLPHPLFITRHLASPPQSCPSVSRRCGRIAESFLAGSPAHLLCRQFGTARRPAGRSRNARLPARSASSSSSRLQEFRISNRIDPRGSLALWPGQDRATHADSGQAPAGHPNAAAAAELCMHAPYR
jgi:hypothetical protein